MKLTKYFSNGTIYDALSTVHDYIDMTSSSNSIHFLLNTNGDCITIDINSNQISNSSVTRSFAPSRSIIAWGEGIYSTPGYRVQQFIDSVLYIEYSGGESFITLENPSQGTRKQMIKSTTKIRDFKIDSSDNIIIAHDTNKITKLDFNRNKIYSLSATGEIYAIDIVKEHKGETTVEYPIILSRSSTLSSLQLSKIDEENIIESTPVSLGFDSTYHYPDDPAAKKYNLTNYDFLKNNRTTESLIRFRLTNIHNSKDIKIIEIPVDISQFTTEEHHFTIRFDSIQGRITIFIDGKVYKEVEIEAGKYTMHDIAACPIMIGTIPFYGGQPLNEFIQQNNYLTTGFTIKNTAVYNSSLSNSEVKFSFYKTKDIKNLIASFPSDQRNELEKIDRYFMMNPPGFKSNSIRVIIKNSDIPENIQDEIRARIEENINKIVPGGVNIKDIAFRNYAD